MALLTKPRLPFGTFLRPGLERLDAIFTVSCLCKRCSPASSKDKCMDRTAYVAPTNLKQVGLLVARR